MSQRTQDQVNNVLTTTDATLTAAITYTIPSGSAGYVEATVIGRKISDSSTVVNKKCQAVKNVGGTASLIGSVGTILTLAADVSLSSSVVAIAVSSGNVLVNITGVAATTIEWFVELTVNLN